MLAKMEPVGGGRRERAPIQMAAGRAAPEPAARHHGEGRRRLRRARGDPRSTSPSPTTTASRFSARTATASRPSPNCRRALEPMAGEITRASRLQVGYFAQHQLEELDPAEPSTTMWPSHAREAVSKIRGRAAMSASPATSSRTKVEYLSGGEKARLMLALATLDKPKLLILDEPTNHLDIDGRGELLEALNDFEGACILVTHDRRLIEASADRLLLVANGRSSRSTATWTITAGSCSAPPSGRSKGASANRRRLRRPRGPGASRSSNASSPRSRTGSTASTISCAGWTKRWRKRARAAATRRKSRNWRRKRAELERALVASEEAWFELSAEAEER